MDRQFPKHSKEQGWIWSKAKPAPAEPDGDTDWLGDWNDRDIALKADATIMLDNSRALILATGQSLGDDGQSDASHASPGIVLALYFRVDKKGWVLDGTPQGVTASGSQGNAGVVKLVDVGNGIKGFTLESGGTWQGYTVSSLSLFAIGNDGIRHLPIKGDVPVGYSTCEESPESWVGRGAKVPWLNPVKEHADETSDDSAEPPHICHDVTAKWHFEKAKDPKHYDLVLTFTETASEDGPDGAGDTVTIPHKPARYRWHGTQYKLIGGKNPVPEA